MSGGSTGERPFNKTILIWKKTWKRLGKIIEKCKSFVKKLLFSVPPPYDSHKF